MKKILLGLLVSFLIISTVSPVQAAIQKTIKVPVIQTTAEQFQKAIDTLITKTDKHETRIVELEKKVAALEEKITKLENKSVVNDENSNTQQSSSLRESNEVIPLNSAQQNSSSLNQKISDFLSSSSDHIENNQFIDNATIKP